jgi:hypothetical protein
MAHLTTLEIKITVSKLNKNGDQLSPILDEDTIKQLEEIITELVTGSGDGAVLVEVEV